MSPKTKFAAHLMAFSLMILASVGLIFAIPQASESLTWALILCFAIGNILALIAN